MEVSSLLTVEADPSLVRSNPKAGRYVWFFLGKTVFPIFFLT